MNINPFIDLIAMLMQFYNFLLISYIIITWLTHFNLLNQYSPTVIKIADFLYRINEPVLRHVRKFIPTLNGIDLSPIVVFILLRFINSVLYSYFYVK